MPRVLHVARDHLVMEWLGDASLADLLREGDAHAACLWRQAGDALVAVHAAGQHLSQGFARNIMVDTRREPPALAGLIDFEDEPLEVMPLADAQVRDWLSFLHSTLYVLPLPTAEADAHIDRWMAAEPLAVRGLFLAAARRMGRLRHLPKSRRFGRDTVALQAAASAAHRFAGRHRAAPAPSSASDPEPRS